MKSVRKKWLVCLLVVSGISLINSLFTLNVNKEIVQVSPAGSSSYLLSIIVNLIGVWILYHCAYKKRGVDLLTLNMIFIPIGIIMGVLSMCFFRLLPDIMDAGPLSKTIFWISIPIHAWFWINCSLLRKENIVFRKDPDNETFLIPTLKGWHYIFIGIGGIICWGFLRGFGGMKLWLLSILLGGPLSMLFISKQCMRGCLVSKVLVWCFGLLGITFSLFTFLLYSSSLGQELLAWGGIRFRLYILIFTLGWAAAFVLKMRSLLKDNSRLFNKC